MDRTRRVKKPEDGKDEKADDPRTRKLTTAKMKKQMIPKIQRKAQMSPQTQKQQTNLQKTAQTRQQLMRKMQKFQMTRAKLHPCWI